MCRLATVTTGLVRFLSIFSHSIFNLLKAAGYLIPGKLSATIMKEKCHALLQVNLSMGKMWQAQNFCTNLKVRHEGKDRHGTRNQRPSFHNRRRRKHRVVYFHPFNLDIPGYCLFIKGG